MNEIVVTHIVAQDAWEQAQKVGIYEAPSLQTEGFIHCSTLSQVVATASRFYRGIQGLVLLYIDVTKLDSDLIYEQAPHGDEYFPHLFGPLNLDAVFRVEPFVPDATGAFTLPPEQ